MNFVKNQKNFNQHNVDSINIEQTDKGEIPNSPKGSIKLFALNNTSEGIKIKLTYDNNFEEEIQFDNFISLVNNSISAKNFLYHRVSKKNFTFAFSESRDLNRSLEISTPKSTILNEEIVQISNNNYCYFHNEKMVSYCFDCQMNLCEKCNNHINHEVIKMDDILLSNEKIEKLNKTIIQAELTIERFVEKTKEKIKALEKSLEYFKEMNLKEISLSKELLKLYEMKKQKNELNFHYIYNIENFIKFNFPFPLPEEKIPITDLISYLNDCHNYILKETQINLKENFQEQRRLMNYYPIKSMTILKDGRIACSNNNQIKIFDKNDFDYFNCITTESLINCLIQLKDERLIVGLENNNICIIKLLENGESKIDQIIKGHNYSVLCIQELSNNEVASCSKEGELKFWYKKIIKPYKKKKERVLFRNATAATFKRKFIQEKKIFKKIKGNKNEKKNNKVGNLYMSIIKKINFSHKNIDSGNVNKKDSNYKEKEVKSKNIDVITEKNDLNEDKKDDKIKVIFERKKIVKKNDKKEKNENKEEKKENIKEEEKKENNNKEEEKKEEEKIENNKKEEEKKEIIKEEEKKENNKKEEEKKENIKEEEKKEIIKEEEKKEIINENDIEEKLNINLEIEKMKSQENESFQIESPRREKENLSTIENLRHSTSSILSFTDDLKQDLLKENILYKKHSIEINKSSINQNSESQIEYPMLHTRESITIDLNKSTEEDLNKTQVIYHRPTIKENNNNLNNTEDKIKKNIKLKNVNEFEIDKDNFNKTLKSTYNTNNILSLLNSTDQIPEIKTVIIPMSSINSSETVTKEIKYKDTDYMLATSFDSLKMNIFQQINKNEIVGTSFKNQSVIIINIVKKTIEQEFKNIKCSFNNQSICIIDEKQFLIGCDNYFNLFKNENNGLKSIKKIEVDIDWIHCIYKLKELNNVFLIGDGCGSLREICLNEDGYEVLKKKNNCHKKEINCICVNGDNKILTGGEDQQIIIWK